MPSPRSRSVTPKVRQYSRPPMVRMRQLHQQLQAGRFPNCRKVADELEVSPKTIQRDIEFMRDQLGLPIAYDQLHFGFIYTEKVTAFPTFEVSEGELVALFVAEKALAQYRGTSFEKPLRTAFEKISEGLKDHVGFQWGDIDAGISFRGLGPTVADLELFETVSRAVLDSHEIVFDYKKLKGARHEPRRVQPYHLGCLDNQWYLIGHDLARKQLRTFALPRMRAVRDTKTKFRRPASFSITKYLGDSLGVFKGGERQAVRIQFDAFAARLVSERQWHPSQKIKDLTDGGLELSLVLGGLEEVERWVLSWGSHARVIAPEELRTRIRREAEAMLAAN